MCEEHGKGNSPATISFNTIMRFGICGLCVNLFAYNRFLFLVLLIHSTQRTAILKGVTLSNTFDLYPLLLFEFLGDKKIDSPRGYKDIRRFKLKN